VSVELITAPRLRGLFGDMAEAPRASLEASFSRCGPPDDTDIRAISQRLKVYGAKGLSAQAADAIAARLVTQACEGVRTLHEGAPAWHLSNEQVSSFEAVLQVRGRPALRVEAGDIESLDNHPGAQFWAVHIDMHRNQLIAASRATGSVRVTDGFGNAWGHGTGFLVGHDLVLTNRHVLIAPGNGQALVQRVPGVAGAQLKSDFTVTLDFAFDQMQAGQHCFRVIDVPFISAADDPVDAALLRIESVPGLMARPLEITQISVQSLDYLYVIGHPGRLLFTPEPVNSVFGRLDECKRISFGRQYPHQAFDPPELLHDASTIGGYSGGPVLGFDDAKVKALHYWGDPRVGNRAISATALHRHPQLGPMLRQGNRT
jgi:hypothetical protein